MPAEVPQLRWQKVFAGAGQGWVGVWVGGGKLVPTGLEAARRSQSGEGMFEQLLKVKFGEGRA